MKRKYDLLVRVCLYLCFVCNTLHSFWKGFEPFYWVCAVPTAIVFILDICELFHHKRK